MFICVSNCPGQCSFGRGLELTGCNWNLTYGEQDTHLSGTKDPTWQLSSGQTSYFRGGPPTDASGDRDGITAFDDSKKVKYEYLLKFPGGYLLMETSGKGNGMMDTYELPSGMLNATLPEGRCVVFQQVKN